MTTKAQLAQAEQAQSDADVLLRALPGRLHTLEDARRALVTAGRCQRLKRSRWHRAVRAAGGVQRGPCYAFVPERREAAAAPEMVVLRVRYPANHRRSAVLPGWHVHGGEPVRRSVAEFIAIDLRRQGVDVMIEDK